MAKMFYTQEEAAEKLGMTPEQVRELASRGKLDQYRDKDKFMYKRDQVDAMASGGATTAGGDEKESTAIGLADSGYGSAASATDAVSLADEKEPTPTKEDTRQATGVSVFDADEVEQADPMAQTQVTQPVSEQQEELAAESVGSGSGLLDLTRESDDTSLGAELLDEIYPGGEGSDSKLDSGPGATATAGATAGGTATGSVAGGSAAGSAAPTSSGVFDAAIGSGASGLENIASGEQPEGMVTMMTPSAEEAIEPAWDGAAGGLMVGSFVVLVVGLLVAVAAVVGTPSAVVAAMTSTPTNVMIYAGGMAIGCVVFAVVGLFLGKMLNR